MESLIFSGSFFKDFITLIKILWEIIRYSAYTFLWDTYTLLYLSSFLLPEYFSLFLPFIWFLFLNLLHWIQDCLQSNFVSPKSSESPMVFLSFLLLDTVSAHGLHFFSSVIWRIPSSSEMSTISSSFLNIELKLWLFGS